MKYHNKHLRNFQQRLPRPQRYLDITQTHFLRNIKTNLLLTLVRLYHFRSHSYLCCPNCSSIYANLEHRLLQCSVDVSNPFLPNPSPNSWSAWLALEQLEDETALLYQAMDNFNT